MEEGQERTLIENSEVNWEVRVQFNWFLSGFLYGLMALTYFYIDCADSFCVF